MFIIANLVWVENDVDTNEGHSYWEENFSWVVSEPEEKVKRYVEQKNKSEIESTINKLINDLYYQNQKKEEFDKKVEIANTLSSADRRTIGVSIQEFKDHALRHNTLKEKAAITIGDVMRAPFTGSRYGEPPVTSKWEYNECEIYSLEGDNYLELRPTTD